MESETEVNSTHNLDDDALQELYTWIDEIPLSRPKRNIARDFSDGVLVAEIVNHFLPKIVEMHNYSSANSVSQKKDNWTTLQRKVLSRLDCKVSDDLIDGVCKCRAGTIEILLINLRNKIDKYLAKKRAAALRKQHQLYDEFSTSAISDQMSYAQDEVYSNGGPDNSYGFTYNTASQQEMTRNPYGMPNKQESFQGSYYDPQSSYPLPKGHESTNTKRESIHDTKHLMGNKSLQTRTKQQKTNIQPDVPQNIRILLEEKEQSLLASQETIQILQVKVRRLEHLLQLKDIRIEDLSRRLQQATQPPPKHLPPQYNPPVPPISGAAGQALPRMHTTPPLPPVRSPPKYSS